MKLIEPTNPDTFVEERRKKLFFKTKSELAEEILILLSMIPSEGNINSLSCVHKNVLVMIHLNVQLKNILYNKLKDRE